MKICIVLITILFFQLSCKSIFHSHTAVDSKHYHGDDYIKNKTKHIEELPLRTLICNGEKRIIESRKDLLNLNESFVSCMCSENFNNSKYKHSDLIYIFDNIEPFEINYVFPSNHSFRGGVLFDYFVKRANNFDDIFETEDVKFSFGAFFVPYYTNMIRDYNGMTKDEYINWYSFKDDVSTKQLHDYFGEIENIKDEDFLIVKRKREYDILLYAISQNHINLKEHGKL